MKKIIIFFCFVLSFLSQEAQNLHIPPSLSLLNIPSENWKDTIKLLICGDPNNPIILPISVKVNIEGDVFEMSYYDKDIHRNKNSDLNVVQFYSYEAAKRIALSQNKKILSYSYLFDIMRFYENSYNDFPTVYGFHATGILSQYYLDFDDNGDACFYFWLDDGNYMKLSLTYGTNDHHMYGGCDLYLPVIVY